MTETVAEVVMMTVTVAEGGVALVEVEETLEDPTPKETVAVEAASAVATEAEETEATVEEGSDRKRGLPT